MSKADTGRLLISSARLATHYRLSLRPSEDAMKHNAFNLISRSVGFEKGPRGDSTGVYSNSVGRTEMKVSKRRVIAGLAVIPTGLVVGTENVSSVRFGRINSCQAGNTKRER
jgi:hypothetical protein